MESVKKKLLEELMSKLSEMEDPLMGSMKEGEDEECEDGEAEVKVMKISAEPMDKKKKLKLEA